MLFLLQRYLNFKITAFALDYTSFSGVLTKYLKKKEDKNLQDQCYSASLCNVSFHDIHCTGSLTEIEALDGGGGGSQCHNAGCRLYISLYFKMLKVLYVFEPPCRISLILPSHIF